MVPAPWLSTPSQTPAPTTPGLRQTRRPHQRTTGPGRTHYDSDQAPLIAIAGRSNAIAVTIIPMGAFDVILSTQFLSEIGAVKARTLCGSGHPRAGFPAAVHRA